jgi:hypothetical protein
MLQVLLFSNTVFFLTKIPLLIARFKAMAMTLGTANPNAQGHEATNIPTPLSTIQQISQSGTVTALTLSRIVHTTTANELRQITPLTK